MSDTPTTGIKLWTVGTPNGHKCSIYLEELKEVYPGFKYDFKGIAFSSNEQKEEWFLKINPNGRIPALTDYNVSPPHQVFESASINLWLAENYDKENKFWFASPTERSEAFSWIFFAHGGVGPMQGQANHFYRYAPEKIQYGIDRYINETIRLFSVLEDRLAGKRENAPSEGGEATPRDYLVGEGKGKYSLADINVWPWVRIHIWSGIEDISQFPNLSKWLDRIAARPAVQKGLEIPEKSKIDFTASKETLDKHAQEASKWIMAGNKKQ